MFAFIFREIANKISSRRQSCSPMSPLVVITATLRVTVLAVIVVISSTIVILGVCVGPWIVVVSLVVVVSRAVILLNCHFMNGFRFTSSYVCWRMSPPGMRLVSPRLRSAKFWLILMSLRSLWDRSIGIRMRHLIGRIKWVRYGWSSGRRDRSGCCRIRAGHAILCSRRCRRILFCLRLLHH